jgi:hypothetical protein
MHWSRVTAFYSIHYLFEKLSERNYGGNIAMYRKSITHSKNRRIPSWLLVMTKVNIQLPLSPSFCNSHMYFRARATMSSSILLFAGLTSLFNWISTISCGENRRTLVDGFLALSFTYCVYSVDRLISKKIFLHEVYITMILKSLDELDQILITCCT